MTTIEAGVFAFLVILSFGLMAVSFRFGWPLSPFLRLLSIALFMGTAVILASGTGVQQTVTISDGQGTTWTEARSVIPANGPGVWLNYVFVGFGILNLILIVREIYVG